MKNLALGVLFGLLVVACGGEDKMVMVVTPDARMQCNPLLNTGCAANEKCTWLLDALMPNYVGHVGCAPAGTKQIGEECMYGAPGETGYDDCAGGSVCSNFRGTAPGVCKAICDQQGGEPTCANNGVCVVYANLFDTGPTSPAAAGVCNQACDPLAANDYDGSGTNFTRADDSCGSAAEGCYGSPSFGTPPVSGWSCTRDINYGSANFVHRSECSAANGCADEMTGDPYTNSCSQGYLPLLLEAVGSTTVVCIAFCEPENCFMGNCGANNANRQGKTRASGPNHRCTLEDRDGVFDGLNDADGGTHCRYLWRFEIDSATSTYLPSSRSDTLGFCYDHGEYQYDSNGNMEIDGGDAYLPNCGMLEDGFGSGSDASMPLTYFGAAALGCVDSTRLEVNGKPRQFTQEELFKMKQVPQPRAFYDQRVYQP